MTNVVVHWFRNSQRLHDNLALVEALSNCDVLYPVFIWDDFSGGLKSAGYNRVRFIHDSLKDLDRSLRKHGARLYILRGQPQEVLRKVFEEWNVTRLTVDHDLEPVWGERDAMVKAVCGEMGVEWAEFVTLTLYNEKHIYEVSNGRVPACFDTFKQILEIVGQPDRPLDAPDLSTVKLPIVNNYETLYSLPSLTQLGYELPLDICAEAQYIGGESEAMKKLEVRLKLEAKCYREMKMLATQTDPQLVGPPMSLSPYLRNGNLSIRKFYWDLRDNFNKVNKITDEEPLFELTEHLIWRDFFYIMSVNVPNYSQMKGNQLCMQIDWYDDPDVLQTWKEGRTGFPWIDACMRQMVKEGWIHHVCRHAVTCFLTRGDLWQSWEAGFKVFEHYLLDADWSVCAGNWMWVSSSAFENCLSCPQCYSPWLYGACMDPTGEYIKRYVPEVKNLPLKYLFRPWKAPLEIQREAGCIVGKDYPEPMVDHMVASKECRNKMEKIKNFYKEVDVRDNMCVPSNKDEVFRFAFLDINKENKKKACSSDDLCNKITDLGIKMGMTD